MRKFTRLTSIAAPLLRDNIDTDAIIPSREMRSTGKSGLADGLFAPWRYTNAETRAPNPDFVLNDPQFVGAEILLGGANFGCGSSREHAVWALVEYGIRCIIAPSFAPIFANNCTRNGLLPAELDRDIIEAFAGQEVAIDLRAQTVTSNNRCVPFQISAEAKTMLMEGLDPIDLTLEHAGDIAAWHSADKEKRPWIYLGKPV